MYSPVRLSRDTVWNDDAEEERREGGGGRVDSRVDVCDGSLTCSVKMRDEHHVCAYV